MAIVRTIQCSPTNLLYKSSDGLTFKSAASALTVDDDSVITFVDEGWLNG